MEQRSSDEDGQAGWIAKIVLPTRERANHRFAHGRNEYRCLRPFCRRSQPYWYLSQLSWLRATALIRHQYGVNPTQSCEIKPILSKGKALFEGRDMGSDLGHISVTRRILAGLRLVDLAEFCLGALDTRAGQRLAGSVRAHQQTRIS